MRRKAYPVSRLTGGLDVSVDPVFLTDNRSPNLKMVRFHKGLIKKELGFASFGTGQRILNGDMEFDGHWANYGTPANNERSNAQANSGTYSRKFITDAANEGGVSNNFCVTANSVYNLSFAVHPATNTQTIKWDFLRGDNAAVDATGSNSVPAGSFATITANVTANATGSNAAVRVYNAGAGETFYVDDVSVTTPNPTDERVMYLDTFYKTDGTEYFICCTPTRMYHYNNGVWEPIDGSNVFTGGPDDQFSTTIFEDLYIITNGQDSVKKWDGDTFGVLGGLSAVSVDNARAVISYNSRVILGFTTEGSVACPMRVRWSVTGESEQWDPVTYPDAGFADLIDTPDWVVGFAILVDRLFVIKERSIWELSPTKDLDVFEPRLILDGIGSYAVASIVSLGDVLLLFGTDDVYYFDGTSLKSVGEPLFPYFYTTGEKKVNTARVNRTASVYVEELGDYLLCLPTIGDDPDWMVRYNVNEEYWTQRDKEVTAFGFWSQLDFEDWSESTGFWDNSRYDVDWLAGLLPPGAPITILGDSTGMIEQDNRITSSSELMTWESKDFIFAHSERITGLSLKCKGNANFTLKYSTNQGRTWSAGETRNPDPNDFQEEMFFFNLTCETIRFQVLTQATDFQIMWIEPWYIERARTQSPSLT